MCQYNSVSVKAKTVKCYRMYRICRATETWRQNAKEGELVSFFDTFPIPQIGVKTKATSQPFHAYKTRDSLRKAIREIKSWKDDRVVRLRNCKIFLCELEVNLYEGSWDYHEDIRSYTGRVLTILKEVRR